MSARQRGYNGNVRFYPGEIQDKKSVGLGLLGSDMAFITVRHGPVAGPLVELSREDAMMLARELYYFALHGKYADMSLDLPIITDSYPPESQTLEFVDDPPMGR